MLHHLPPLVLLPHFLASVPPWVENIWNIWLKFDFWALPFHNWILWLELYSYIDYIWVYTKLWFFQRSPNRSWRNEKHRHSANDRLNWTRWHPCFLGKETLKSFPCKIIFSAHTFSPAQQYNVFHAIGAVLNSSVLSKLPCGFSGGSAAPRTACSSVTKTNAHAFSCQKQPDRANARPHY